MEVTTNQLIMDSLWEIRTPLKFDRSYDIIRIDRGEQENDGKFVVAVVCPQTSNGAQIVLSHAQLKELGQMALYVTK